MRSYSNSLDNRKRFSFEGEKRKEHATLSESASEEGNSTSRKKVDRARGFLLDSPSELDLFFCNFRSSKQQQHQQQQPETTLFSRLRFLFNCDRFQLVSIPSLSYSDFMSSLCSSNTLTRGSHEDLPFGKRHAKHEKVFGRERFQKVIIN